MSMIPQAGDDYVRIPLTFDIRANVKTISKSKIYGSFFLSILLTIGCLSLSFFGFWGFILGVALACLIVFLIRTFALNEKYFMKKYKELEATNGIYEYNLFWNIFDIDEAKPYICHLANGYKALFVSLPKDVILGKGEDSEYLHYEGVTAAYGALSKNGISCMHIDYMDIVGKDTRLQKLFDDLENTKDPNLKRLMYSVFNHIRGIMSEEIASYDVYCFYTRGPDELFLSSLDLVITGFHRANYLGHILMSKEAIADLVMSIFNIGDFQVKQMCEGVLENKGSTNYLRLIWTEKNGEHTKINKTKQELDAERAIQEAEKEVKVKKNKHSDDEIEL